MEKNPIFRSWCVDYDINLGDKKTVIVRATTIAEAVKKAVHYAPHGSGFRNVRLAPPRVARVVHTWLGPKNC
jgi:hypothetical protein